MSMGLVSDCEYTPKESVAVPVSHRPIFRLRIPLKPTPRRRVKHKRYAGAMAHTVCIAATCENAGNPVAILCSDTDVEVEWTAKGKVQDKTSVIRHDVSVMLAGSVDKANELIGRYMACVNRPEFSCDSFTLGDAMRAPLRLRQRVEIEDYICLQRGISYEQYNQLSDADKEYVLRGMSSHSQWPPCELILVLYGFHTLRLTAFQESFR